MRSVLKTIASVIAVLVVGVLGFAATKPDEFRVVRSISIKAPPEKIFPYVNDFHAWTAWSPWEKLDPAMQRTFEGPAQGKGAVYGWKGNGSVGAGRMQIAESTPSSRILIDLQFIEPFAAHNKAEYTFQPKGDTTEVTWSMAGPAPFVSKLMQVFVNMDRMVGQDFEKGLANLKAAAEK
jgi:uncharacterized protein YndB with AHSA1/START domain